MRRFWNRVGPTWDDGVAFGMALLLLVAMAIPVFAAWDSLEGTVVSRGLLAALVAILLGLASVVGGFRQYRIGHVWAVILGVAGAMGLLVWSSKVNQVWSPVARRVGTQEWQWLSLAGVLGIIGLFVALAVFMLALQSLTSWLVGRQRAVKFERRKLLVPTAASVIVVILVRNFYVNLGSSSQYVSGPLIWGQLVIFIVLLIGLLILCSRVTGIKGRFGLLFAWGTIIFCGGFVETAGSRALGGSPVLAAVSLCLILGIVLLIFPPRLDRGDSTDEEGSDKRSGVSWLFGVPLILLVLGSVVMNYSVNCVSLLQGQSINVALMSRSMGHDQGTQLDVLYDKNSNSNSYVFEFSKTSKADILKRFDPGRAIRQIELRGMPAHVDCESIGRLPALKVHLKQCQVTAKQLNQLASGNSVVFEDVELIDGTEYSWSAPTSWEFVKPKPGQIEGLLAPIEDDSLLNSITVERGEISVGDWAELVRVSQGVSVKTAGTKLPAREIVVRAQSTHESLANISIALVANPAHDEFSEQAKLLILLNDQVDFTALWMNYSGMPTRSHLKKMLVGAGALVFRDLRPGQLAQAFAKVERFSGISKIDIKRSRLSEEDWLVLGRITSAYGVPVQVSAYSFPDGFIDQWVQQQSGSLARMTVQKILDAQGKHELGVYWKMAQGTDITFGTETLRTSGLKGESLWNAAWALRLINDFHCRSLLLKYATLEAADREELTQYLRSGNWVMEEDEFGNPVSLYWPFLVRSEDLKRFAELVELRRLFLCPEWVNLGVIKWETDLSSIAALVNLEELRISPWIRPTNLSFLDELPNLRVLELTVGNKSLNSFSLQHAHALEELILYGVPNERVFRELIKVKSLKKLTIVETESVAGFDPKKAEKFLKVRRPDLELEFFSPGVYWASHSEEFQQHRQKIIAELVRGESDETGEEESAR